MLKLHPDAISAFGANIATCIILEKFVENKSKKLPIFFNARTLFRNYVSCLDGKSDDKIAALKNVIKARPIIKNFIEDTKQIVSSFIDNGYDINIYEIGYKPFLKRVLSVRKEEELKGIRATIHKIEKAVLNDLNKTFPGIYIKSTPRVKFGKEFYVVTHIGIELLNFVGNKKVHLAESHTGDIKDFTKWYNKYAKIGTRRMDVFSFNEFLYNILGDYDYVQPMDIKLRRHIFKIAIEEGWHSSMSESEVKLSLRRRDPILFKEINKKYRKYF